jgi:hypothetical protein
MHRSMWEGWDGREPYLDSPILTAVNLVPRFPFRHESCKESVERLQGEARRDETRRDETKRPKSCVYAVVVTLS